jgi:hypothetical protein
MQHQPDEKQSSGLRAFVVKSGIAPAQRRVPVAGNRSAVQRQRDNNAHSNPHKSAKT